MLLHDYHAHPWLLQLYETHTTVTTTAVRDPTHDQRRRTIAGLQSWLGIGKGVDAR